MALFDWFSRKKTTDSEPNFLSGPNGSGGTQPGDFDARPGPAVAMSAPVRTANRKADNAALREQLRVDSLARREHLYSAVRQAMLRMGVAVSTYKFKVLALDQSGRQYLVMVDLGANMGKTAAQMTELEQLIADTAKSQHDIIVTGVYWRLNEQLNDVAAVAPLRQSRAATPIAAPTPAPAPVPPAPVFAHTMPGPASAYAPTVAIPNVPFEPTVPVPKDLPKPESAAPVMTGSGGNARYEPLQTEEMLAFKRALAATGSAPQPSGPRPAPRTYSPLATGYEDTQVVSPETRPPGLGSTQYGDL